MKNLFSLKNLLSLELILCSNIILGGEAVPYLHQILRTNGSLRPPQYFERHNMPFYGIVLGLFNGLKFGAVSAITDYFKPWDNTTHLAIKIGINLVINAVFGDLACDANQNLLSSGQDLALVVFGTLCVMDATNFVIENVVASCLDNPDCIELADMQIIE